MAEGFDDIREFFGDPNPTPKAPKSVPTPMPKVAEAKEVQEPMEQVGDPIANRRTEGEFTITDKGDVQDVYFTSPSGEVTKVGGSSNSQNKEMLDRIAIEYAGTGTWNAPNDFVEAIRTGVLTNIDYFGNALGSGIAKKTSSGVGWNALQGKGSLKEASAKSKLLREGHYALDRPVEAWEESKLGGSLAYFAWGIGNAVKTTPHMLGAMDNAARKGMILMGATQGMAFLAGGPAMMATVLPASVAAGHVGLAYGLVEYSMQMEGGALAIEMYDAGFNENTIMVAAPLAGAVSGVLEAYGMKFLAPGMASKMVGKVLTSAPMKKMLANNLVKYGLAVGGETSTEVAQEGVNQITKQLAAIFENKPELMMSGEKRLEAILETLYAALAASFFLAGPGAMISHGQQKKNLNKIKIDRKEAEGTPKPLPTTKTLAKQIAGEDNPIVTELETIELKMDPAAYVKKEKSDYFDYGVKNANNENLIPALAAKNEALDMKLDEMMEDTKGDGVVFSERNFNALPFEEQTPFIPLLEEKSNLNLMADGVKEGKTKKPKEDALVVGARKFKSAEQKPKTEKVIVPGIKDKVIKAKVANLNTELKAVRKNIDLLAQKRKERMNMGVAVKVVTGQIATLRKEENFLDSQIAAIQIAEEQKDIQIKKSDKLQFTPISIKNIVEVARKAGASLTKHRAGMLKEVASFEALTDYDLKKMIGNKRLDLMTDLEFKKFIDMVRKEAGPIAERKQALHELQQLLSDKEFQREASLRRFHELPTITKMSKDQLQEYAALLSEYAVGGKFLTTKQLKATGKAAWLVGAKTNREVIEKFAESTGITVEQAKDYRIGEFSRWWSAAQMGRQGAIIDFMENEFKRADARADNRMEAFETKLDELAAAALKSRKIPVLKQLWRNRFPVQPLLMEYVEGDAATKAKLVGKLTSEELELVNFMDEEFGKAYDYLVLNEELNSSRFSKSQYVFHMRRGVSEILLSMKGWEGLKKGFKDMYNSWKLSEEKFSVLADPKTKTILSKHKFFKQTLFRSDEMVPSQNIVGTTKVYMREFFKKVAYDEAIPSVDAIVTALSDVVEGEATSKTGKEAQLEVFTREWINLKKGKYSSALGIQQGGWLDLGLKTFLTLISFKYLAFNLKIQGINIVGETFAKIPLLRPTGIAKANWRRITPTGRAIIKKYKGRVGRSALEEITKYGITPEAQLKVAAYAVFSIWRKMNLEDILLGNMTKKEYESQTMSEDRWIEVRRRAARWLDIANDKSIIGATSLGLFISKFRSWAFVISRTLLEDFGAVVSAPFKKGGFKKNLNEVQKSEIIGLAETAVIVTSILRAAGDEEDKDSLLGYLKWRALMEANTVAISLRQLVSMGMGYVEAEKMINLINTWIDIALGDKELAEGVKATKRQFTMSALKGKKKEKSKFTKRSGGSGKRRAEK